MKASRFLATLALLATGAPTALMAQREFTSSIRDTRLRLPERREALIFRDAVPRLVVGQSFRFTVSFATTRSTVAAPSVRWQSSDPAVASVDAQGTLTARSVGRVFLTAESGGLSSRIRVSIVAPEVQPVASVTLSPGDNSVEIGGVQQYTATARDMEGSVVSGATFTWSSSDTTVAVVSPNGLATGRKPGIADIRGSAGGVSSVARLTIRQPVVAAIAISPNTATVSAGGTQPLSVTGRMSDGSPLPMSMVTVRARCGKIADGTTYVAGQAACADTVTASAGTLSAQAVFVIAPPAPPSTPVGSVIALRLRRFDGGTGDVLVSSGVPLAPGQLRPADASRVRLLIGGREVAAYIVPLKGLHRDGSIRSMLVQVRASIGADAVPAELQLGVAPSIARASEQPTSAEPDAMALPTSAQLIASQLVGPTMPLDSTTVAGFDEGFEANGDAQWAMYGAKWDNVYYYDRALNHIAYWVRGGGVRWMRRALAMALNYRTNYIEVSGFGPAPHWAFPEGLALHYWLTGDEASRQAILKSTDRASIGFDPVRMADPSWAYIEGRIQARMLLLAAYSHALEGGDPYRSLASGYVNSIVSVTKADGSYSWPNWCGYQGNYMVALQNDALVKFTRLIGDDARILPTMKLSLDYLWNTQWRAADRSFNYTSGPCPNVGDTIPAPDLTALFASSYSWYAQQTRNETYRMRSEEIMSAGITGRWLGGPKQFNQVFYNTFEHLRYRRW